MILWEQAPEILCNENYKIIYMRFFTLCSYLITKESYNWWIIRRKLGFRHQISKAKYQKMSIVNIWKHLGEFRRRTRWLRNWPSTWCDRIPMALTSSFQLRFANRLKRWIDDFPASKKHIVCIKWTSGSAPKVSNSWCPLGFFMLDFSLCFHPCIHDLLMAKDYKAPKLRFFM